MTIPSNPKTMECTTSRARVININTHSFYPIVVGCSIPTKWTNFYCPQTKFWAKLCFHRCLSVHNGGLCMMSLPVWLPGPMFLLESLSREGGFCRGGGGICRYTTPRIRKRGAFSSYWNVFLYKQFLRKRFALTKCEETSHDLPIAHLLMMALLVTSEGH